MCFLFLSPIYLLITNLKFDIADDHESEEIDSDEAQSSPNQDDIDEEDNKPLDEEDNQGNIRVFS